MGESASEARHKHFKADRKFDARKCNRVDNMSDVFNRAMDSSDPLLFSLHITKLPSNKKSLPTEVIDLLDVPSCPVTSRLIGANTSQSDDEVMMRKIPNIILMKKIIILEQSSLNKKKKLLMILKTKFNYQENVVS